MTESQEKKLDECVSGITELKSGLSGRGGVFDRLDCHDKKFEFQEKLNAENSAFRGKVTLIITIAVVVLTQIVDYLKSFFTK